MAIDTQSDWRGMLSTSWECVLPTPLHSQSGSSSPCSCALLWWPSSYPLHARGSTRNHMLSCTFWSHGVVLVLCVANRKHVMTTFVFWQLSEEQRFLEQHTAWWWIPDDSYLCCSHRKEAQWHQPDPEYIPTWKKGEKENLTKYMHCTYQ